jgi:hypothetical protein
MPATPQSNPLRPETLTIRTGVRETLATASGLASPVSASASAVIAVVGWCIPIS